MKDNIKAVVIEYARIVVIALVIALLVRTYVAEARYIPSESMLPTLKIGDHLIIDKISYEIKGLKDIQRGDIVVFDPPAAVQSNDDIPFIKRVIALPGETVSVNKGTVYINGEPLNEPYIMEKPAVDFKPYTVPGDMVFVMGDNRNHSNDSRYWGPLPAQNIIGKAEFRYFPINDIGILY